MGASSLFASKISARSAMAFFHFCLDLRLLEWSIALTPKIPVLDHCSGMSPNYRRSLKLVQPA
jgi:hypothetical protein